ncbi:hypothetical protein CPB85DRAFT_1463701 [Mucidula mucida]|nr:hypothetical protein CPB85DRAFT_1463701 [Mucidula mucida]
MNRHATLEVPASGGRVNIILPMSVGSPPATLTFDIPAPGGTIKINLMPNDVLTSSSKQPGSSPAPMPVSALSLPIQAASRPPNYQLKSSSEQPDSTPPRMLFSSLPLPIDKPRVVKYTPLPRPEVKPRISSYVPRRYPSPEPDVHLEDPPAIPADLSDRGLLMYGYFIDAKFCKEKGIEDTVDAANDIIQCLKALRIVTFAKTATFPENDEIELFYFAVRGLGGFLRLN